MIAEAGLTSHTPKKKIKKGYKWGFEKVSNNFKPIKAREREREQVASKFEVNSPSSRSKNLSTD